MIHQLKVGLQERIKNREREREKSFFHERMRERIIICDGELKNATPKRISLQQSYKKTQ